MNRIMLSAVVCAAVSFCPVSAVRAADADVTGLVPTIWWDFETKPDASGLATANKGSASISFSNKGTAAYATGVMNGWALSTDGFSPYSASGGKYSTAGNAFTISAVMTLGTRANGVTLNVRCEKAEKDLVVRRGTEPGSLVIGLGPQKSVSTHLLNATFADGDAAFHLVSIVAESSGTSLYVDGNLVTNTTEFSLCHASGCASRMQFGERLSSNQSPEVAYGGLIDDLRIHDAALTPAQIKTIAAEYGLVVRADALTVTGSPVNWGDVVPAYGITNGLSEGATVECSAVGAETETTKTIPIGYGLYSIASDGTETPIEESSATSFTYTHGAYAGHLVWHWAQSNMVSVASGANGSVSEGGWVGYGDDFTVTATPGAGYKFLRWTGDTDGIDVLSAAVVLQSVTAPVSLAAEFVKDSADVTVQYVSPTGSDDNDGYFESSPKKTIAAAVNKLAPTAAASSQRCTVHVAPGLYPISNPIVVTNAISVIGDDPDPLRTAVSNTVSAGWDNQSQRIFRIDHAGAVVANLTMQAGQEYGNGGNFNIGSSGGMVSNCVVEAGYTRDNGKASGAWLDAGVVTHTVFRKNWSSAGSVTWEGVRAGLLQLNGQARAENCLFVHNNQTASVRLINVHGSSVMRNCTIADTSLSKTNDACTTWCVLNIASGATVQNVVIAGVTNTVDGTACPPTGSVGNFQNGAFDGDVTGLPEGTVTGTAAEFFEDYANGGYTPSVFSPLANAGVEYEGMAATDLAGKKRKSGKHIDIGCYECQKTPGLLIFVR